MLMLLFGVYGVAVADTEAFWHLAPADTSCRDACKAIGGVCDDDALRNNNSDVNTGERIRNMLKDKFAVAKLNRKCDAAMNGPFPLYIESTGECFGKTYLHQRTVFSCAAVAGPLGEGKRRICYCKDIPVQNADSEKVITIDCPVGASQTMKKEVTCEKAVGVGNVHDCRLTNAPHLHSYRVSYSESNKQKVIVERTDTHSVGGGDYERYDHWAVDLHMQCELEVTDWDGFKASQKNCACTGNNDGIPKKNKKFSGTDYGKSCRAWDLSHRYCSNEKALAKGNRECWCPKSWCYVPKSCFSAKPSALFQNADLYYSYEACDNEGEQCFVDENEFVEAMDDEIIEDSKGLLANLNPKSTSLEEVANILLSVGERLDYLEKTSK